MQHSGDLACCHRPRPNKSNRNQHCGKCDIHQTGNAVTPYHQITGLQLRPQSRSPPSFAVPRCSHGRHHQCVPRTPVFLLLSSPQNVCRPSSRLPQASAPLVGPQVLFRLLPDRRRLGHPRALPKDLEASPHQGMACAQDHLPLHQALHADMLHRNWFVPTGVLPPLVNRFSYRPYLQPYSSSIQSGRKKYVCCREPNTSPRLTPTPGP